MGSKQPIEISVYFTWEWWEKHFKSIFSAGQGCPDDILLELYLARKRFLFEQFGQFGIGEENPKNDGKYVNLVLKWGMDFIPKMLGYELVCNAIGGYTPVLPDIEMIKRLRPVEVASTPEAEWILKRAETLTKRYGKAEQAMALEGPVNIAARLRGTDFYLDLMEDEGLAKHCLDVSTEMIIEGYRFLGDNFELKDFTIADCCVTMISPEVYENKILEYDIRLAKEMQRLTGEENCIKLHHCDVPIDWYMCAYSQIPGIRQWEASYTSDIFAACAHKSGSDFAAMVSPMDMIGKDIDVLERMLAEGIGKGVRTVDLWNIDPACDIDRVRKLFLAGANACRSVGAEAEFRVMPFCWDELEWAFPKFQ